MTNGWCLHRLLDEGHKTLQDATRRLGGIIAVQLSRVEDIYAPLNEIAGMGYLLVDWGN